MNFMKTLVAASVAGAMMVGAVCAQEDSLRPRELAWSNINTQF